MDDAIAAGKTDAAIAKLYGFSASAVERYRASSGKTKERKPLEVVDVPAPENGSPQEIAKWHCERILARTEAAEKSGTVSEKEIASMYGQYTNALRHHARLSGALDITEAQIVKSAPWVRLMAVTMAALKEHPKALRAVADAVAEVVEGKAS